MTARLAAPLAAALALAAPPASAQEAQASPPAGPTGGDPYARLLLMPDLSAVGSFGAAWDDGGGDVRFYFEELELGLQATIDPYAKAAVFIAFTPEEVAVEEAYLVTTGLPAGLQLKAGQVFSPFGRVNVQHPHAWDFADRPIASTRVLADEALSGPGLDVAWLAPLPWFAELHLAGQSTAPAEGDDLRLTGVARLAQFLPLGDETTLGVGLSAGLREEGAGGHRDLAGADLYLRWRPPATRTAVTLQGEWFARRFRGVDGGTEHGLYAQAVWRGGPYWALGARWDQAPADPADGAGDERRLTGLATWYLSEFQRLRLQGTRVERPGGQEGWEALLQAEFGIGAHGAHPF